METRPRIRIALSPLDKKLEFISTLLIILMWALTLYSFLKLPSTIPIHYNALGEADSFGNKSTLFVLAILASFLYLGLSLLNRYPHVFNYMIKITSENAERQYTIATRTLRFIKFSILLVFNLIILFTYLTTVGVTNGIGTWFLPLVLALFFIPTIISVTKSFRAK